MARERWGSKFGIILAVAGSAVGLGNFLRFPGLAAASGGGAFMIPYFVALILLGLPLMWVEWTIGRFGGGFGHSTAPGMFQTMWNKNRFIKYFGVIGIFGPLLIMMYYTYIESWLLGYSFFALFETYEDCQTKAEMASFLDNYRGYKEGEHFDGMTLAYVFYLITFAANFFVVARGIKGGIERFCKWAMPVLMVLAVILLVRVVTLPADEKVAERVAGASVTKIDDECLGELTPESERVAPLATAAAALAENVDGENLDAAWASRGDLHGQAEPLTEADLAPEDESAWWPPVGDDMTDLFKAGRPKELRRRLRCLAADAEEYWAGTDKQGADAEAYAAYLAELKDQAAKFRIESRLAAVKVAWDAAAENLQEPTVGNGFGFLWNPRWDKLMEWDVWLAAAGQVFFTLSVGIGAILTYASYLRKNDDVALSGLTAASTNTVAEVILGGSIVIPAAFVFFGAMATQEFAGSIFDLGFLAMPMVLQELPLGNVFGFIWFFLLFLAGVTSSISLAQPAIAFLQDEFGITRKEAVIIFGIVTFVLCHVAVFGGMGVIGELDFWAVNICLVGFGLVEVIMFGWVFGINRAWTELHAGSDIRIPRIYRLVIKWVTPLFLLAILGGWLYQSGYREIFLLDVDGNVIENAAPKILTRILILLVFTALCFMVWAVWRRRNHAAEEASS